MEFVFRLCDVLKKALTEIVAPLRECSQLGLFKGLAVGEVRVD